MAQLTYIVIASVNTGNSYFWLDSVWTSKRKAELRCQELNEQNKDDIENGTTHYFAVERRFISK